MIQNILQPTGEQVRQFRDRQTGEPIAMLNLLKFKARAEYADGRESNLTGREAYELYAKGFHDVMDSKGVTILYLSLIHI